MRGIKYICAQPRTLYYAWQVEVMLRNFTESGIPSADIHILVACNPAQTEAEPNVTSWDRLVAANPGVGFYFYEDTRTPPVHYISSVRPNILKQHFQRFPGLSDQPVFYHDCDIVFTRPPDWGMILYDRAWYLSDTNSYLNYDYIVSKGRDVYDLMCQIVGMDPLIPRLMNSNSGGAQYIMKGVDHDFWAKVERDSEELFRQVTELSKAKKAANPKYHELQIWCADMWAVLWNAWLAGHETRVVPEMAFSWATDTRDRWEKNAIYHNAGATGGEDYFSKGRYMDRLPYDAEDTFSDQYCSKLYFERVRIAGQNTCLR